MAWVTQSRGQTTAEAEQLDDRIQPLTRRVVLREVRRQQRDIASFGAGEPRLTRLIPALVDAVGGRPERGRHREFHHAADEPVHPPPDPAQHLGADVWVVEQPAEPVGEYVIAAAGHLGDRAMDADQPTQREHVRQAPGVAVDPDAEGCFGPDVERVRPAGDAMEVVREEVLVGESDSAQHLLPGPQPLGEERPELLRRELLEDPARIALHRRPRITRSRLVAAHQADRG